MKFILIIPFSILVLRCLAQDSRCNLDAIFPHDFVYDWKSDSLGVNKKRAKYYAGFFTNSRGIKNNLPFIGISTDCLMLYFGKPNKLRVIRLRTTYIYFMAVTWISKDGRSYEGITIEFEVCNTTGLVVDYLVMIT